MTRLWQRSTNLLFSEDPILRVRTSMAALALALMVASALVMAWLAYSSYASSVQVAWWSLISISGLMLMSLAIRLGMTNGWRDPALTFPHIIWGVTASAIAYVIAGEGRGVVPGLLAVTLLFAALNLKAKQIMGVALYALLCYAGAIAWIIAQAQSREPALEIAHAGVLVAMLLSCMLLSLRLYQMRTRLRKQRQELANALAENKELASRDMLTGLINRRHMLELLHLEQRRCLRGVRTMLLAQMDLDHFKSINDTYGHAVGDLALRTFANVVRENIRNSDVFCRWGGEEFVLLLSDAHLQGSIHTLNRVRCAVQEAEIEGGPAQLRISVSIGLAEHIAGESVEATLDRADKALYSAKRAGRNQVVLGRAPTAPVTSLANTKAAEDHT